MSWHDNLAINQTSLRSLESIAKSLPHSTIVTGQPGVGTFEVAKSLAKHCSQNVILMSSYSTAIKVKDIRDMMSYTKTKTTTTRIFLIDNADTMTRSAQNAFLKILEEPVANTHFILTTHNLQALLPTVRSRCQEIFLHAVDQKQTNKLINNFQISDDKMRQQINFIASGLPAEITRLAVDKPYFEKISRDMETVRTLMQGEVYAKTILIQTVKGDRVKSLQLIEKSILVVRRLLTSQPNPQLVIKLDKLLTASARIKLGANIRLQLLNAYL